MTEKKKPGTQKEITTTSAYKFFITNLAMKAIRRSKAGIVTVAQIDTLANHIMRTGQTRFTKEEIHQIIGETQNAL